MPNRIISESCNTSPTLAAVSLQAEALFWHLTTRADDYGCFEANPRLVNCACFPLRRLRDSDIASWLEELAEAGLIELYEVDGKPLGAFKTWAKHQRKRESKPKFPLPTDSAAVRRNLPQLAANGGNSPRLAARARTLENESRERIFSSPRKELGEEKVDSAGTNGASRPDPPLSVPEVVEAWKELLVPAGLPDIREMTEARRRKLHARLRDHPEIGWWKELFSRIRGSPFLLGKNERGWRVSIDWLISNDTNIVKVMEGKYSNAAHK